VTAALLLLGAVLLLLALADRPVRRLPMTPALVYLALGWAAGPLLGGLHVQTLIRFAEPLKLGTEFALLVSLLTVGLRLRMPPTLKIWGVALLLAGPGMVATIALTTVVAHALLGLPWPLALLLAAVLAPTDPVLASEVQIRSDEDRDAVRLSLTAEGGLNDGSALPGVMLALGLLGLHELGDHGGRWWWADLAWPIGGGALVGAAIGFGIGLGLRARLVRGDAVTRDELVYVGAVALAFGAALALQVSTFIVAFAVGATLLMPLQGASIADAAQALAGRMQAFGARIERLVEAGTVLAVGALLSGLDAGWGDIGVALLLVFAVRPLAVLATVRQQRMPARQRRLVAWFGIRGIGTLFYLLFALQQGLAGEAARLLVNATVVCVAVSIVVHGISATPLMAAHQRRRERSK